MKRRAGESRTTGKPALQGSVTARPVQKPLAGYAAVKKIKPPKARRRIKKRNAKRKGSRFPGRRNPKYLAWERLQPCVVSGLKTGNVAVRYVEDGRLPNHGKLLVASIVPAHNPSRGAGGYDADALPMETRLHDEQHRIGIQSFCALYELDWPAQVLAHQARYTAETGLVP